MTGTSILTSAALRRDRVMLVAWMYVLVAVVAASAYEFKRLYPTSADRLQFSVGANHITAELAIYGHMYDPASAGGLVAWRCVVFGALVAAIMSVMIVVRHTRAEEETGRLELLGAGVLGRHAAVASAVTVAFVANLAFAVVSSLIILPAGLPASGAFAMGLAMASTGCVFAAVAAVCAQLSESARAARGIALAVLGVTFFLRAFADADDRLSWLSWASPIGWAQHVRPFAGDHWWVLALPVVAAAVSYAAAVALNGRRDLGAGLVAPKPGRERAGRDLSGAFGLAWRLQRGAIIGWAAVFVVYAAVIGAVTKDVTSQLNSPGIRDIMARLGGQQNMLNAFLATEIDVLALIVAAAAVQMALRVRAEETDGRAEVVLSTALGRLRWAASHLTLAFVGSAVFLAGSGLIIGLTYGATIDDVGGQVPRLVGAGLAQIPAVWVIVGIAVAAFGALPRTMVGLAWGALAVAAVIGEFGPALKVTQWVLDVSPFTHVARVPGPPLGAAPIVWLLVIAAGLTVVGAAALRRRDIPA